MRDFAYAVQQIAGLVRYYQLEDGGFATMSDSGPLNMGATGAHNWNTGGGQMYRAPSTLLDQHRQCYGYAFTGGHISVGGIANYNTFQLGLNGATDSPNSQSWSWILAGLKPHDMSVRRTWLDLADNTNADRGMWVSVATDGTLTCGAAAGSTAVTAAGTIVRFTPHLLIGSYDFPSRALTVWVGDWTGRWITAINAVSLTAITASVNGNNSFLGNGQVAGSAVADGFLDDFAIYVGHAITSSEARALFEASGYSTALSYTPTKSHRHSVFNQSWSDAQPIASTSAAAASEFANQCTNPPSPPGAGGANMTSNSIPLYQVTGAYRQDNTNVQVVAGPTHYGHAPQVMLFEDCPLPYAGRPSLGFSPSGLDYNTGGDQTVSLWCPDTDEYWEMYGISNTGTDLAPAWTNVYGWKYTQFSLNWASAPNNFGGDRATGIPVALGVPSVSELVAAQAGTPIPHALVVDCLQAKSGVVVWPAQRTDGNLTSSSVIQGQLYRFKRDAATTNAINAMPHQTGRMVARAIQAYGLVIADSSGFSMLMQWEDPYQFQTLNGYQPYLRDASGNTSKGILNGQTFSANTMAGAPYGSLELLDSNKINPADAGQPIRSAPIGLAAVQDASRVRLTWSDDPLAASWNVYQHQGGSYVKLGTSWFAEYSVWNPADGMVFAVTAVNGGGESARTADVAAGSPPIPIPPHGTIARFGFGRRRRRR